MKFLIDNNLSPLLAKALKAGTTRSTYAISACRQLPTKPFFDASARSNVS